MARRIGRRPRRQPAVPMLANVLILSGLLVGILVFKGLVADRAAEFVGQFGADAGTGEGTAESRVPIAVGVAGELLESAVREASERVGRMHRGERGDY